MTRRFRGAFVLAVLLLVPAAAHAQSSILADLQAAKAARCVTACSPADLAAILNEAAWKHRAEGVGMLSKPSGNNCPQPSTGTLLSCDWLTNLATGTGADVIGDAGGASTISFSGFTQPFDTTRFVAPVDPGPFSPTPTPTPAPVPTPPVPPTVDPRVTLILAQLVALGDQVNALAATLVELRAQLHNTIADQVDPLRVELEKFRAQSYTGKILGQPVTLRPAK